MKYIFLLFAFHCNLCFLAAQKDTVPLPEGRFFWDEGIVVFEFNELNYAAALARSDSQYVVFSDFDLLKAIREPNLSKWQQEGWQLSGVPDNYGLFQLRKPIESFTDQPNWLLRLLASTVGSSRPDSLVVVYKAANWYELDANRLTQQLVADTGNVVFRLKGYETTQKVILSGSFNQWNEQALTMRKTLTGWELRLNLPPGEYEYKFIADGKWTEDPDNPDKVVNQHGTFNSILKVHEYVRFMLPGYETANVVYLAGSFNNWNPNLMAMQRTPEGWVAHVPLVNGKHLYKFVVDGQWIIDPKNKRQEEDREGNVNSVLMIR
jgi:Glycogen recognition site of AMP-activated protein kinase